MCYYVVLYNVVLCLVMMILCRVMADRILLVGRFASLESRKYESLTRIGVKSCWLESLVSVYATIVDKSR